MLSWEPSSVSHPSHSTERQREGWAHHLLWNCCRERLESGDSSSPFSPHSGVGPCPYWPWKQSWRGQECPGAKATAAALPGGPHLPCGARSPADPFLLRPAPEHGATLFCSWLFPHVWPRAWHKTVNALNKRGWGMQADLLCPFTPALKLTLKERDDEPHKRLSQNGFSQSHAAWEANKTRTQGSGPAPLPHQPHLSCGPAGSPYSTILCPYQSEDPAGHIMREERRNKKGNQGGKKKSLSAHET